MRSINARDLRNEYARVLREVQSGETFTITNRGRPVAEIVPVGALGAHPGTSGPRDAVPLSDVVGALHFLGPGKAEELRRDIDDAFETGPVDPFGARPPQDVDAPAGRGEPGQSAR